MTQSASIKAFVASFIAALAIGPLVAAEAQQPVPYPREIVKFCPGFNATGAPSDVTGPVTVVYALGSGLTTPPASVTDADISYAEFSSEALTTAGESVSGMPSSSATSTWTYLRGRWPIKMTKKLVAGAWSTTVILESMVVNGYDRHRLYVRKDNSNTRVRVNLRLHEAPAPSGPPPSVQVDITFPTEPVGTWKYVETVVVDGVEQLAAVQTIDPPTGTPLPPGSPEYQFVTAIHGYATAKNFLVRFP